MSIRLYTRRNLFISILAALLVAGPGGGDGEGGGDSKEREIRYTGNTAPPAITTSNASTLVTSAIGADYTQDFLSPFWFTLSEDRVGAPITHGALRLRREFNYGLEATPRRSTTPLRRSPLKHFGGRQGALSIGG